VSSADPRRAEEHQREAADGERTTNGARYRGIPSERERDDMASKTHRIILHTKTRLQSVASETPRQGRSCAERRMSRGNTRRPYRRYGTASDGSCQQGQGVTDAPGNLFVTPLLWIAGALALAVVVSLLAGAIPSRRAVRLQPLDALRYE